ncbi:MAG: ATP-binding cassette domain-containing protein [Candidatus Marinimicrobia bacterium]|nr:ATP-binding cassette domain-containing protein [Candidatus Neomarinimicrobiota bacterium]
MIRVKNLTVRLESANLLFDISCSIPKNKITAILGKSGSGKTLLVKSIFNLIPFETGTIEYVQKSPTKAMVFQSSALLDSLTLEKNLALPITNGRDRSLSNEEKLMISDALQSVGLNQDLKKYPSQLSGGMKKRAAIARAICTNPQILFYDEPTTGLDPQTKTEILKLIEKIHHEQKLTSIVVTHEFHRFENLVDHVVFIEDGKLVFEGGVEQFIKSNLDAVKRYLEME